MGSSGDLVELLEILEEIVKVKQAVPELHKVGHRGSSASLSWRFLRRL